MLRTATTQVIRLTAPILLALSAVADVHYVDGTNPACPGHGTQGDPFCQIQRALDVARDGDSVIVSPGVYPETLDFLGHDVLVVAVGGAWGTIVDATGLGSVVTITGGEGPGAILDGFTLTGGVATYGGGILVSNASPVIRNCWVLGNQAVQSGGGLSLRNGSGARIVNCDIQNNLALGQDGGGLHLDGSSVQVQDCEIIGNVAAGRGGGAYVENQSSPGFLGNYVRGNQAGSDGGGLFLNGGSATISGCELLQNRSVHAGGAVYASNNAVLAVDHTLYALNEAQGGDGGALCLESSTADLRHVTVAGNLAGGNGGGLYGWNQARATVLNSIFWGNGPGEVVMDPGAAQVTYTDVEGGLAGTGNFGLDPQFWDASKRDYYLDFASPCIDAGDPASPPDPDGSPADMGAYPFDPNHDQACGWYRYCSTSPNSVGYGAVMDFSGSISVAANDLVLMAAVVPLNNWGKFFYSSTQIQAPLGDGFLCGGHPYFRLPTVNSGPVGTARYALDLSAPFQATGTITAGSSWNFQYWYRDPVGVVSSHNLSDALSITFCP